MRGLAEQPGRSDPSWKLWDREGGRDSGRTEVFSQGLVLGSRTHWNWGAPPTYRKAPPRRGVKEAETFTERGGSWLQG